MPGHADSWYWEPCKVTEPVLKCVHNLEEWEACPWSWRSPSWQAKHLPKAKASLHPAVRPIVQEKPQALHECASKKGFWVLGLPFLRKLAELLRILVPAGTNLLGTLVLLITKVLKCTAAQALFYIQHRLALASEDALWCYELSQLDDVDDVIDRFDKAAFKSARKRAKRCMKADKRLQNEYQKHASGIYKELEKGKRGPKPKARKAPDAFDMEQSEAKKWIPEGTSIWRDNVDVGWETHCPPFRRVSFSQTKYGNMQVARRLAFQDLWRKHLALFGKTPEECPIVGIFDPVLVLDGSSDSSSSDSDE